MDGVREGIKYLFQTKNSLTFALSSSGHGGIECTFANLLEPGETLIVARCGYWGDRAAEIAGYHGKYTDSISNDRKNNFRIKMLSLLH